jgi:pimeloyl-ACP methyl ester carboxylesterase
VNGVQQVMTVWKSVVSRLSKNYRNITFDFPGQGKSKILTGLLKVTFDEQIEIIRKILVSNDAFAQFSIAGASWGGLVAAAFAAKYPHRVNKLLLGSFGVKKNRKMKKIIERAHDLYKLDAREEMGPFIIKSFGTGLPENYKQQIINQFQKISRENIEIFYQHILLMSSQECIDELIDLKKITAKTLMVYGQNDPIIDFDDVVYASYQIPHCELKIIPDTGHFLHFEKKEIIDIYVDFLCH